MTGIATIIRKELADSFSNRAFILCLLIFNLSMVIAGSNAGTSYITRVILYRDNWPGAPDASAYWFNEITPNMVYHVTTLGALVAVVLSFNSINRERSEGSLKVLLSYPVYRDQVILGKLAAGLINITLVALTSIAIAVSVFLLVINVNLTLGHIVRFALFTLLTILYLSFYLGLGMTLSIAFKDLSKTLMVIALAMGFLNSDVFYSMGRAAAVLLYGAELKYAFVDGINFAVSANPRADLLQALIMELSPTHSYRTISIQITKFVTLAGDYRTEIISIPVFMENVLQNHFNCMGVLVVALIATFVASYILFTRSDVA